jgi:isoleucyl-tRNA synthetase
MRGYRVERRFGWDTHGLPVEMAAEQELGVSGRAAITAYGIDRFNDYCRSLVGTTADVWHSYVTRSARWVDMANDYKTLDPPFMESVMWAFKTLHDKGLVYEDYKVLPYCWECQTPLSNFETRLDDAYRDRQDPALTVFFELETGERLLVWTTTPWTLPSNLAVAVGADIDYAVFDEDGTRYIIGEATIPKYEKELAGATRVGTLKGSELAGRRYTPLFPWFADTPNAFRVITADFVSVEDGTGAVHLAPGFGEDDQRACDAVGIPVVCPVDERTCFTAEVPAYEGMQVFDANPEVIRDLKAKGVVVRHDTYVHAYPHCWRTDTPLVYKAVSSWFVDVTAVKTRMLELNQEIAWVPSHVKDGSFGKWLEGARDWSITRNRYWGSPIPVWKSDDPAYPRIDVYGSLDQLEADFGVRPTDLHRPMIDELTRPNPDDPTGRSTMRRVEDVLDCWFESGSMPFAQVHYPFENGEWFETHFPGDFIVEYIGQTRAWFYNLHVLATALLDRPAFKTCVVHGVLLGDDGKKLSKRLRNYPDPIEVFDTLGADAMRWALLSSAAVRGGDMVADRRPMKEAVRQVLLPIWNAWYFLSLYANAADTVGEPATGSDHVLDRFVLARTAALVDDVERQLDAYDLSGACGSIASFLDALNNWYIRRSRDRFWAGDQAAVDTLHTVLHVLCQVAAPLLPLLTEKVYRDLTGAESVHLVDWPSSAALPADPALVAAMETVRSVCSAASSVRKASGVRVRQPLSVLSVSMAGADVLRPFLRLIADEVNVKTVELLPAGALGTERVEVDLKTVGRQLGADTPKVVAAMKQGNYELSADGTELTVLDHRFGPEEFTRKLIADDPASSASLDAGRGLVRLDLDVTPELEAEGMARDVIRGVNELRRTLGFDVSDRIRLLVEPHHAEIETALRTHRELLATETLATDLVILEHAPATGHHPTSVHGLAEGHRLELADGRSLTVSLHALAAEATGGS